MPELSHFAAARGARFLLALAVVAAATLAAAQDQPRRKGTPQRPAEQPQQQQQQQSGQSAQNGQNAQSVLRLLPEDAVTQHSIETAGGKLEYTATAGTLSLFNENGERLAAVYYTAYVAKSANSGARPVTFGFNGGPGAASAFLTLGVVGPRIAEFGLGNQDPAAARLRDNPETWLRFTDLVMVDPVGTGWSRPAKSDGGGAFWGVRRDADSMAKFVALYVAKNSRANSPKYILGESYGGFRAAKVARALQRDQGIAVSGIVMLSPLIEGGLNFGGSRFALGAALQFPSLAAAELERKGAFSKEKLAEAERFALTDYLSTLTGPAPRGEAGQKFYARVAELTGLPEDVVARSRGFIRDAYVKNLRAGEGKIVSHYDATFAVADPHPESETARGPDPLLDGVVRAYTGAYVAHARDELGFKTDMTYVLLASDISGKWDWNENSGRAGASASDDLRVLLSLIPSFRLLIVHGYSDMVTPYGISRYVLDHLPDIGEPGRTQLVNYRGGHMFYLDDESRRAFSADAKAFYQAP